MVMCCRNTAVLQEQLRAAQAKITRLQDSLKERAEVERQKAQLEQENQHWQKAAELLGAESPADVTAKLKALREECLSTGGSAGRKQA